MSDRPESYNDLSYRYALLCGALGMVQGRVNAVIGMLKDEDKVDAAAVRRALLGDDPELEDRPDVERLAAELTEARTA